MSLPALSRVLIRVRKRQCRTSRRAAIGSGRGAGPAPAGEPIPLGGMLSDGPVERHRCRPEVTMTGTGTTTVIELSGVQWASSKCVAEAVLSRRPGVLAVDANPVSQTATITYDTSETSIAELAGWIRDCGYHCVGRSVPDHLCDPMAEPIDRSRRRPHSPAADGDIQPGQHPDTAPPGGHDASDDTGPGAGHGVGSRDFMSHGGQHGGMSMDGMVADMRRRFIVAAALSGADPAVVTDRPGGVRVHRACPVRAAGRRVLAVDVPAGDLLFGLDLFRRSVPGAPGTNPGHDGAGRRRGGHRLAVQHRGHPDRSRHGGRRRRLL